MQDSSGCDRLCTGDGHGVFSNVPVRSVRVEAARAHGNYDLGFVFDGAMGNRHSPRWDQRTDIALIPAFDPTLPWKGFGDQAVIQSLLELAGWDDRQVEAACTRLPFYKDHVLVQLRFDSDRGTEYVFGLACPKYTHWLDGDDAQIYEANDEESLHLSDAAAVADYIRFYLFFRRYEAGPLVLIESWDTEGFVTRGSGWVLPKGIFAHPLSPEWGTEGQRWATGGLCAYNGRLYNVALRVTANGVVERPGSSPPFQDLVVERVPEYPSLSGGPESNEEDHVVSGERTDSREDDAEPAASAADARELPAPCVFISYRRDDTDDAANQLKRLLTGHFGEEQVFLDVDSIDTGADWADAIDHFIARSDVVLALIGHRWVDARDEDGNPRLEDPDDFVRLELEAALRSKVRVFPVLVYGAKMPRKEELPESLAPLARRQAKDLPRGELFQHGVDVLVRAIERSVES